MGLTKHACILIVVVMIACSYSEATRHLLQLVGPGSVNGSNSVLGVANGTLSGNGELSDTLGGNGALNATGAITDVATGSLNGSGTLNGTSGGSGTLNAIGSITNVASGSLDLGGSVLGGN